MTEDSFEQPEQPHTLFEPLKGSTRIESGARVGDSAQPDTVFEPLRATSTRIESNEPDDAIPLVVVDDDEDDQARPGDAEMTRGEILGELRSLRSRNQILRTERTSIAGRKYALEVVIESLREKLEGIATLCDSLDAPGEVGEKLKEVREILGDARRIATSKAVLEADLEAERAKLLQERQRMEQAAFDRDQDMAGLQSERDALRQHVARLDRERTAHMERLTELQEQASDQDKLVGEVEVKAAEQLESYMERITELEETAERQQAELQAALGKAESADSTRAEVEAALEEAVMHAEAVSGRTGTLEIELAQSRAALAEAETKLHEVGQQEQRSTQRLKALDESMSGRVTDLEAQLARQQSTMDEQKKALVELKPILEDWTRLDKECQRLARLVGEARERGRVNVQELMARAALLKRLEKLTADDPYRMS